MGDAAMTGLNVSARIRVDLSVHPRPDRVLTQIAAFAPPAAQVVLVVDPGQPVPATARELTRRTASLDVRIDCPDPATAAEWVAILVGDRGVRP